MAEASGRAEQEAGDDAHCDTTSLCPTLPGNVMNGSPAISTSIRRACESADRVMFTTKRMTWVKDEAVALRMEPTGAAAYRPMSVPTLFDRAIKNGPQNVALGVKRENKWQTWTYLEYRADVLQCGRALIKAGLKPYHGVAIIGFNSPEWVIAKLGAIHAGGLAVGVYTTNSPEACEYVIGNCEANVVMVEDDVQLRKILKVRQNLPDLKAIVQYTGQLSGQYENTYTWGEFMALADDVSMETLEERIAAQNVNKCCAVIYTSGTTGNPKGVMMSHDNYTWNSRVILEGFGKESGSTDEIGVSYLPLSHAAAQMLDVYLPMYRSATVYFAQPDALKGSLVNTLTEVRPTYFLGVPRVWEKIEERMNELGKDAGLLKRKMVTWAKSVGLRGNKSLMNGGSLPWAWRLANTLVFKKVKAALGLDRCDGLYLTGAAPMRKETSDFFLGLNIPLVEHFGLSETVGSHCQSLPWNLRLGSVGKTGLGKLTKLVNPDSDGNGEICISGRHLFMGYLNMEDKTLESVDDDGWFYSGDVGRVDKDGFHFITGRSKELIITAGGENVAPMSIEDAVKVELPIVSNCVLIGDKRKFLSILLTLKTEIDSNTMMPTDVLGPAALDWCTTHGTSARTVRDVLDNQDEAFKKGIQDGINRANSRAISRAQCIQKWSILPIDFSIPGGELGPTLKIKRYVVADKYASTIDALYK